RRQATVRRDPPALSRSWIREFFSKPALASSLPPTGGRTSLEHSQAVRSDSRPLVDRPSPPRGWLHRGVVPARVGAPAVLVLQRGAFTCATAGHLGQPATDEQKVGNG